MTLVVARRYAGSLRLLADSQVEWERSSASFTNAALKIVILSPELAIAYANDVHKALEAVRECRASGMSVDDAVQFLTGVADAEFIVASSRPELELTVVKDGRARADDHPHIGHPAAFNAFQETYLTSSRELEGKSRDDPDYEELADWTSVVHAFVGVVDNPEVAEVGQMMVEARGTASQGFMYLLQSHFTTGNKPVPSVPGGVALRWGDTGAGDFSYTQLRPEDAGVGMLGSYFAEGDLGVFWCPLDHADPIVVHPGSIDQLIGWALENLGVRFVAGTTVDQVMDSRGVNARPVDPSP